MGRVGDLGEKWCWLEGRVRRGVDDSCHQGRFQENHRRQQAANVSIASSQDGFFFILFAFALLTHGVYTKFLCNDIDFLYFPQAWSSAPFSFLRKSYFGGSGLYECRSAHMPNSTRAGSNCSHGYPRLLVRRRLLPEQRQAHGASCPALQCPRNAA